MIERSSALLEELNAAARLSETRHAELAQIVRETRSRRVDARFSDVVIRQAGENTYEVLDINPLGAITLDQLNGIENPSLVQITDGLETHTLAECQQRAFEGTRINLDGPHDAAANAVLHATFVSANSHQPAAICKHAADAYGHMSRPSSRRSRRAAARSRGCSLPATRRTKQRGPTSS